jgi:hypothetical protein
MIRQIQTIFSQRAIGSDAGAFQSAADRVGDGVGESGLAGSKPPVAQAGAGRQAPPVVVQRRQEPAVERFFVELTAGMECGPDNPQVIGRRVPWNVSRAAPGAVAIKPVGKPA